MTLDDRLAKVERTLEDLLKMAQAIRDEQLTRKAADDALAEQRAAERRLLAEVPGRLGVLDERVSAVQGRVAAIEQDAQGWDRWIGVDGYLRSRAFGGLVLALLLLVGAVGVEQATGWLTGGLLPVTAPAPAPVPPSPIGAAPAP